MDPDTGVDLNADLGEGCPWDADLLPLVTSASIACGGHAGGREVAIATFSQSRTAGIVVGAHPGFADPAHFGRREMDPLPSGLAEELARQVDTLGVWAHPLGVAIRFLKPHGALYNQAQRQPDAARIVVECAAAHGLPVLGMAGGLVESAAAERGVVFVAEGFADRGYAPDGRLLPRDAPGAILNEPAEIRAQVLRLVAKRTQSICIHGDRPDSIALARLVRETLDEARVAVRPFLSPA